MTSKNNIESIKTKKIVLVEIDKKTKKFKDYNYGFEYDPLITNDKDLYHKIINENMFIVDFDYMLDDYEKIYTFQNISELKSSKKASSIVAMCLLGYLGCCGFHFTLDGNIIGNETGKQISYFAEKKIKKFVKKKEVLTEYDIFLFRMESSIEWLKYERKKLKYNLNSYRLFFEKILVNIRMIINYQSFPNLKMRNKVYKILLSFKALLLNKQTQKALILTYKLMKLYMKQNDLSQIEEKIAEIINKIFIPIYQALQINENKTTLTKLFLYYKLDKLIKKPWVLKLLNSHPDFESNPVYLSNFFKNLDQPINITNIISELFNSEIKDKIASKKNLSLASDDPIIHKIINNTFNVKNLLQKEISLLKSPSFTDIGSEEENLKNQIYDFDLTIIKNHDIRMKNLESGSGSQTSRFTKEYNTPTKSRNSCSPYSSDRVVEMSERKLESMNKNTYLSPLEQIMKKKQDLFNDPYLSRTNRSKTFVKADRMVSLKKKMSCDINDSNLESKELFSGKRSVISNLMESPTRNLNASFSIIKNLKVIPASGYDDSPYIEKKGSASILISFNESNREKSPSKIMKLESPIRNLQFELEKNYEQLLNYVYEDVSRWDKVVKQPILEVYKRKVEGSPCILIKAIAILDGISPQKIFEQIYDNEIRKKWDTVFAEFKTIKNINQFTDVLYFSIKAPFGVTNRDFLQRRAYRMDYPVKDKILMQFKSIELEEMPPLKGFIRANTIISGYLIEANPNKNDSSLLSLVTQVDVKGAIPKSIVNYTASKAPIDWVNNLRRSCLK